MRRTKYYSGFRVCLALIRGFALTVCLVMSVCLAAHAFGLDVYGERLSAMWRALALHIGLVSLALSMRQVGRQGRILGPTMHRFTLAVIPFLFLASADSLLAIAWRPLRAGSDVYVAHPTRGWALRPGWSGGGGRVAMRFNSLGFRGPEFPHHKPPGERRILFLGDSVTLGAYVAEDELFVGRVKELMAAKHSTRRVRTINASVAAYSPWQEYDLLMTEGLRCDPDVVVQVFCLNDVMDKFQLEQFGGYSRGFEPPAPGPLEWSGLYRVARALRARMLRPTEAELRRLQSRCSTRALLHDRGSREVRNGWRITLSNMNKIVSSARHASVRVAIVCAPHQDQLAADPPETPPPQEVLAAFAQKHDVPFLDLRPIFRDYLVEHAVMPSSLFRDPLHFSTAGHDVAAEAIYEFLEQLRWID